MTRPDLFSPAARQTERQFTGFEGFAPPVQKKQKSRKLIVVVAGLVVLGLIAALGVQSKIAIDQHSQVVTLTSQNTTLTGQLKDAQGALDAAKSDLATAKSDLATVQSEADNANGRSDDAEAAVSAGQSCVAGFTKSYGDLARGDYSSALADLRAVTSDCQTLNSYTTGTAIG